MKRLDSQRKSLGEQRSIRAKEYGKYIKEHKAGVKQINPIFTGRPHYDVPEQKREREVNKE